MREDGEGGQAKATGWGMPSWAEYFTPDSGFQHLMTFFHEVLKKKITGMLLSIMKNYIQCCKRIRNDVFQRRK